MAEIHVLLLAAGASERMGEPKQLLDWQGKTLIEHQIETLQKTAVPITVILGAFATQIEPLIVASGVSIIKNLEWKQGMGASISHAVQILKSHHLNLDAILLTLVDQPLIESAHYNRMIKHFKPGLGQIICSRSDAGYSSPPTLFDACYSEQLIALEGDSGAKGIVQQYNDKVEMIRCETSLEDVDTYETYQKLIKMASRRS